MIQIITIIAVGTLWAASLAVVVFEIIIPSRTNRFYLRSTSPYSRFI
jgi:hypothetical protein